MVWGAWSPNGAFALAWRDRRDGGAGQAASFRIYAARSLDAGATFEPNLPVSAMPSPGITLYEGNDFIGIAHTDTSITCTWADARLSQVALQLYSHRAPLTVAALAVGPQAFSPGSLSVLESPGHLAISVQVIAWADGPTRVSLWDVGGRRIAQATRSCGRGSAQRFDFPGAGLCSGVYLVSAESGGRTLARRAVLLR